MHDAGLGQSTKFQNQNILVFIYLVVHTCKLKDVDTFIEQFYEIFYITLRENIR